MTHKTWIFFWGPARGPGRSAAEAKRRRRVRRTTTSPWAESSPWLIWALVVIHLIMRKGEVRLIYRDSLLGWVSKILFLFFGCCGRRWRRRRMIIQRELEDVVCPDGRSPLPGTLSLSVSSSVALINFPRVVSRGCSSLPPCLSYLSFSISRTIQIPSWRERNICKVLLMPTPLLLFFCFLFKFENLLYRRLLFFVFRIVWRYFSFFPPSITAFLRNSYRWMTNWTLAIENRLREKLNPVR